MAETIAYRGPDDAGTFVDEVKRVGLAHRRLSIIDLTSAGHQPMFDVTGRAVIVFNGEIYNFRELRENLVEAGYHFRGHSDTEVILNLYVRYGIKMIEMLNGIFALAIWDKDQSHLLLARDGLGVKPLYYASTPVGVVFGSEIKALLQEPSLSRHLDPKAVVRHLSLMWSPAPSTVLKDVIKLEPGTAILVKDGSIERHWRFYELPFGQSKMSRSIEEARLGLREALERAVERQLASDVPIGAFLSGGLDSSAIVATARRITGERLQCFTIKVSDSGALHNEGMTDDFPYAVRVSRHLDVDLHAVTMGPEAINLLPKILWYLDEPQADPAAINAYLISAHARQSGIKVLLSGVGGDDILAGYRRHQAIQLERYWRWLPQKSRATLAQLATRLPANHPATRRLRRAFDYAGLNGAARIASYLLWLDPQIALGLLNKDFRADLRAEEVTAPMQASIGDMPEDASALDRLLDLDCRYFLADHNLNYTDRMSMAHGVETRVPLLDPDLIAYAASLPDGLKQQGSVGKWIFKKAMEGILPDDIIYRPKTGFGAPLRYWLHNDLREMVGDLLSNDAIRRRGIFDPVAVERLIMLDRTGQTDAAYSIFSLLCIELWCCIFLDGSVVLPSNGRLILAKI